jgi:hypothetical protein
MIYTQYCVQLSTAIVQPAAALHTNHRTCFCACCTLCIHTILYNSGALKTVGYDGFGPYCLNTVDVATSVTYGALYGEIILIVLGGSYAVLSIVATAWTVRKK